MSIYYIEDKNGDYFSADKKRRFIRLTGKQAFIYLKQHRGKRFYKTTTEEENGEKVFIEIPPDKVKQSRRDERHEQYVDDCKNEADIQVVSLNDSVSPDNDVLIEESISNNEESVENMVVSNFEFETLHKAIQSLTKEEFKIINMLFLSPKPMTENDLAELLGISQQMINKRKKSIIKKLKNFF